MTIRVIETDLNDSVSPFNGMLQCRGRVACFLTSKFYSSVGMSTEVHEMLDPTSSVFSLAMFCDRISHMNLLTLNTSSSITGSRSSHQRRSASEPGLTVLRFLSDRAPVSWGRRVDTLIFHQPLSDQAQRASTSGVISSDLTEAVSDPFHRPSASAHGRSPRVRLAAFPPLKLFSVPDVYIICQMERC